MFEIIKQGTKFDFLGRAKIYFIVSALLVIGSLFLIFTKGFNYGVDFSGGEMQKIAIIRALFKNSPVLILDEPTSALDPMAEYEIYQKFSEMSDGKLTIYISHRISSTRFCDKIAVFNKGEIVEFGTFDELMGIKGLYYDFFEKQAEYFK